MRKPLLYYQFDFEKFREGHYQEGYFSYADNGFGKVCMKSGELVDAFCTIVDRGMKIDEIYLERINSFFAFEDQSNRERTYRAILERMEKEKR